MNVQKYNKAIVAVGAAVAVVVAGAADGVISSSDVVEACVVFLGALGVYAVPNKA